MLHDMPIFQYNTLPCFHIFHVHVAAEQTYVHLNLTVWLTDKSWVALLTFLSSSLPFRDATPAGSPFHFYTGSSQTLSKKLQYVTNPIL
jgi:hypothetical protein